MFLSQATNVTSKFYCFRRSCWLKSIRFSSSLNTNSWKSHGFTISEPNTSKQLGNMPVVAIFGWADSKQKTLQKYSDIFTEKNYTTLTATARSFDTFLRPGTKVKEIGLRVLKVLEDLKYHDRPIFLYSFSNGGCAVYFHIIEALTTPESVYFDKFNVAGSIFDSCPIYADKKIVKIVQTIATRNLKNPLTRGLVWYSLGMAMIPVIQLDPFAKRFISDMKKFSIKTNQLFLYSKSDHLSPYADIDDFIAARQSQGVRVVSKCWDTSVHVNHFREHQEEYLKLIHEFMSDCLEKRL